MNPHPNGRVSASQWVLADEPVWAGGDEDGELAVAPKTCEGIMWSALVFGHTWGWVMLSWQYSTAFPCFSAIHVYHWWCSLETMFNIKYVLLFHDFSSPSWISGDFSQFEIPLNEFRLYLSSSLPNEPAARLEEEGVGKQRLSEGVRAVLWLVGGCCHVPFFCLFQTNGGGSGGRWSRLVLKKQGFL